MNNILRSFWSTILKVKSKHHTSLDLEDRSCLPLGPLMNNKLHATTWHHTDLHRHGTCCWGDRTAVVRYLPAVAYLPKALMPIAASSSIAFRTVIWKSTKWVRFRFTPLQQKFHRRNIPQFYCKNLEGRPENKKENTLALYFTFTKVHLTAQLEILGLTEFWLPAVKPQIWRKLLRPGMTPQNMQISMLESSKHLKWI